MPWDPSYLLQKPDKTGSSLQPLCLSRVKRDLQALILEPPPGISVAIDDSNITLVHALIIGPPGTPYENGFFYFIIGFPPDYPISPPMVKLMTTGGVRFNPNLYRNGKVCLSILGTWSGPSWSPAHSLTSVLLSVQSLLGEAPYHNEPGYEEEVVPGQAAQYGEVVRHETLRVAVVGMLDKDLGLAVPPALTAVMTDHFLEHYTFYQTLATSRLHLDNRPFDDPFGTNDGFFAYNSILLRLQVIHSRLTREKSAVEETTNLPVSGVLKKYLYRR